MKKETIFAIILGIVGGVGVAVFMLSKAQQNELASSKSITTSLRITPTLGVSAQFQSLEITQPENAVITGTKSVTIKGKASKGALIVVQSPIQQVAQKVDSEDFTIQNFTLALGENVIRVSMYPKDPQVPSQEKELKVYYLDEQ